MKMYYKKSQVVNQPHSYQAVFSTHHCRDCRHTLASRSVLPEYSTVQFSCLTCLVLYGTGQLPVLPEYSTVQYTTVH